MTSISIRRKSKSFNYQMHHNKRRKPWRRRGNFGKANRDKYRFSFQEFRRTLKAGRSFRYDFRWLDYPSSYAFLHAAQLHTKHGFLPVRWWRGAIIKYPVPISRSWTRRNTPQKRNSASLFARGHDGMRPRRRLKNLAEWSAVKFETRWRFRLSWPEIAQIKSHFRFRGAKPLARVKLSRFHSSIRRPFFLPLIVSLFLNDRK